MSQVIPMMGRKLGQTTFIEESGRATHVTLIQLGPCVVIQKKTAEKEGYDSLQLGFEERKEKSVSKPLAGHFKKSGATPKKVLREVRVKDAAPYQVGQTFTAEQFSGVKFVDVTGETKGKGFQGVVRRHGFKGGAGAHGSMHHRQPGGIGASSDPSRVFPGTRMAGHMGCDKVTILNLRIVKVDADKNILFVAGAVPGAENGLLTVRPSVKKPAAAKAGA
jgi:large subunit ribosomal protein L3